MNPVVIYLKNTDIAASVKKIANERPGWLEDVINYHVNGNYGKQIGAKGFEGYIRCLEERQKRELRILNTLPVESFIVDNPQRNWKTAQDSILSYISKL